MAGKHRKPQTTNYLWVLAGGYLIYLAGKLIVTVIRGEGGNPVLSIIAAVAFLAVGGYAILREWRLFRYGTPEEQTALNEADGGPCGGAVGEEAPGEEDTREEDL